MAVTLKFYGQFHLNLLNNKFNADLEASGTVVKAVLLTDAYTFNQDTHESYADISASEVANGNGYTTGGLTLTNKSASYASRVTTYDADDPTWAATSITAKYCVLVFYTPAAAADKKLILCLDFGENKTTSANTFEVDWDTGGIWTMTVPA